MDLYEEEKIRLDVFTAFSRSLGLLNPHGYLPLSAWEVETVKA